MEWMDMKKTIELTDDEYDFVRDLIWSAASNDGDKMAKRLANKKFESIF